MSIALNRGISRPRHLSLTLLASLMPLAALAAEPVALEQQVITATQTAHSELSAPASVSVVTREELEQRPVYNLADAVKYLPGVHLNPSSTYGRQEIKLRGMDSDYTLLLVNGRRINSRDALSSNYANDFDLSSIPMAAIERIEVIRGPMSSLYGADALGGVVNVILRQPTEETKAGIAYTYEHPTEGDSGDGHKASGYVSGSLIENKLLGNLILETTDQAAWLSEQTVNPNTDAAEQRQASSAYGSLSWLLDERQTIDLDITHRKDDREAEWNNFGAVVLNVQEMERWSFGLGHTGNWDGFNTRVRYYYENVELMDDSQIMTTLRGMKGDIEQKNHTVDGQVTAFLGSHLLTLGSELRRTELTHNQNLGSETEVDQKAVYLQDEFSIGDLDVTLGGRLDDHDSFGSEFSPRAYGVYNLTDNWVIKGSVGRSFKAPSIYQSDDTYGVLACRGMCTLVGNPNLKPETATSYEIGTLYQNERLEAGIMLFNNDIDDMIITDTWRVGYRPAVMTYSNVSKARVQGYELQGRYNLSDSMGVRANYTYSDAEDRDTDEQLRNTPQHVANIGFDWQAMPDLGLNLDYQYTGSQLLYVSAAQPNVESGAFHQLNFGAKYQATRELSLKAGMNNLTNEKRDDVAQSVDNILMGRTVFVGFSYDI
ncbi:TonB-dependent receptor domain-containing protein [Stutzerimonas xanthomarina]|uniref:Outer membrane receptor for ferrienterochelin and colicins n=2 Tax=Stutzerimonas xanthomarina TaxID=271420 RepID=A0A1M5MJE2_9GAMM|nr:TonB-dependent receptor [Stutzerimonas xanthomarina]MCP9337532.1 TonB-dependent receptor [Stutzerimonas xanthomarina]SEH88909.1 outer membrane receptor for ferrienterochelin and colicins [Stutzerimonas xanthomarina]SHG77604.1 outer membrane receptor for ferrienterochelin and colicins [Stutzerimonas xanthomarina DSM 18231]